MSRRLVIEIEADRLRSLLLLSHENGEIDEEELLLLLVALEDDAYTASLPLLQYIGPRLCLDDLDEETCLRRFRFQRRELYQLRDALNMPFEFSSPCRSSWSSIEGLLVLLRRLTYPARLGDLCEEFGRSKAGLSIVFNYTLLWIWETWGDLITEPLTKPYLTAERVASYEDAIRRKSGVEWQVWGFIDGTVRRICRPGHHQRDYYNGHKRIHALKYQGVTTPDGIICSLHGPYEGRRHDAGLFARSGLLDQLREHLPLPGNGQPYALYGDAAYPLSLHMQKGYSGANLTAAQQLLNTRMSSVRQAAEWSFGNVMQYFPYLDLKQQQKVELQPVGLHYKVAALLFNCLTCVKRGNETSRHFNLDPPGLEEYLQLE